jgi:hypothetical protein
MLGTEIHALMQSRKASPYRYVAVERQSRGASAATKNSIDHFLINQISPNPVKQAYICAARFDFSATRSAYKIRITHVIANSALLGAARTIETRAILIFFLALVTEQWTGFIRQNH